eukprot:TRINITY_DN36605_c0_g1_i1.p1 TRINITY_DN36605_c0_g1~~TRINITY_DN36605_c0_g1_i1.p1  ORF type:complete len:446 (+),score=112.97 TRINITY_DN36605_c0_g1_i1:25-1362(+)
MGRASLDAKALGDGALAIPLQKPAKRPANWGAELEEDPIVFSQLSSPRASLAVESPDDGGDMAFFALDPRQAAGGPLPPAKRRAARRSCGPRARTRGGNCQRVDPEATAAAAAKAVTAEAVNSLRSEAAACPVRPARPSTATAKNPATGKYNILVALGATAKNPTTGKYNILEALGVMKQPATGDEAACNKVGKGEAREEQKGQKGLQTEQKGQKRRKKEKDGQAAPPTGSSASKALVIEGRVEERANLTKLEGQQPFRVRLRTESGTAADVLFTGQAAQAFRGSLGLRQGGQVRLEGYTPVSRPDGSQELRFQAVHPGVSVTALAAPANRKPCSQDRIACLGDLKALVGKAKVVVDVEAVVESVDDIERQELAMQPGEFAMTRTLWLRCASQQQTCRWRLWAGKAERHGPELLGHRVVIRRARVHETLDGQVELTGCATVEIQQ